MIRIRNFLFLWLVFPLTLHASFIESTIGTAVVNDATAAYYNPAALTLLTHYQFIGLGSIAISHTQFTGQAIQAKTGFTQEGSASTQTNYYLPSFYLGAPATDKMTLGLAVVSNFFNRNMEEDSILRYAQSSNNIRDIDLVPAMGFKLNDILSLGAGVSFSYANFLLQPILGFPSLNIPDAQSRNEASSSGLGGDAGLLLKPSRATLIGLNYRSAVTYRFSGKSVFEDNPAVISNHYYFNFWTPARIVLSLNQFVTTKLGFIATIQRIQWSRFNEVDIHGLATKINAQPIIVDAALPYHLRDAWLLTLGSHYRMTSKWVVRFAGNYNQAPGNGHYQISNGDSFILGASMGYEIFKNIIIDGSFAHVFVQNQTIDIIGNQNIIHGDNKASRDSFSLKLTFNC